MNDITSRDHAGEKSAHQIRGPNLVRGDPAAERPPDGHLYDERPPGQGPQESPAPPPPRRPAPKPTSWQHDLGMLGVKIGVFAIVVTLVFTFLFGVHYVVEPGMTPAFKDGDLVLYNRTDKNYRRDDLTLVTYKGQMQVRRVVATAGDTVDITGEGLVVNGSRQQEREIYKETVRYVEGIDFPLKLGPGEVFLLGDARDIADDSRIYGSVHVADTHGKVMTLLLRRRNL